MSIWGAVKNWITFTQVGIDKNSPNAMSPIVQSWQENLSLVRTLYDGYRALYRKRELYLPQHPKEADQDYYIRANRPTFYNAFARTVRALAGMVTREPPEPEGVPQPILDLYEDDIDNEGTDGPSFIRATFQDGLVTGLVGIFVNQQSLEGENLSRADELAAGIRPYWELIRMDDIVSFRPVVEDGKTLLASLVFCERRQIPDGAFGVKIIERLRVYARTPAVDPLPASVTEVLYEKAERGNKYEVVGTRQLPMVTEIPLAVIYTERIDFMDAAPPLLDLAHENLLHYQTRSDMHHAAHIANVPFLFGIGIKEDELHIGPNRAVLVEGGDEATALRWVETTGASIGLTRAILSDIDEYMANLGLGMLQRKSRAAQTAEKASLDKQEQDSTLAGIVGDLEDGIERALFYTSQYLGLEEWGKLTFPREFKIEPIAAPMTENQGSAQDAKDPKLPGDTNNPKTRMI